MRTLAPAITALAFALMSTPAMAQAPKASDGKPDFSGFWTNASLTPLARAPNVKALVVDEASRSSDEDDRIDLTTPDDGVPSDVDPDAFAVLARNLTENALKHGAPDASIEVLLDADSLTVRNHGPVVAASEVERLMRPFERGSSRSDGSGLGLAIVAAVCRGAGLELSIASPVEGRADGVSARVTGLAGAKAA